MISRAPCSAAAALLSSSVLQAGAGRDPGEQLERAVGDVLKQAAASGSGSSSMWALFADYYAALGFHTSAREALLKQVRHAYTVTDPSSAQQRPLGCTGALPC